MGHLKHIFLRKMHLETLHMYLSLDDKLLNTVVGLIACAL